MSTKKKKATADTVDVINKGAVFYGTTNIKNVTLRYYGKYSNLLLGYKSVTQSDTKNQVHKLSTPKIKLQLGSLLFILILTPMYHKITLPSILILCQRMKNFKAVLNYKLLHVPFAQQQRLFNFFFAAFKGAILNLNAGVRIVPNIG